jgi:thiol-disulfide isomerase/thioredoxin
LVYKPAGRPWARWLACAALAITGQAHAQGYDAVPWPPTQPVPALTGTDFNGHVWRLSDLRGKAVLLNFWASWCEPCRAEMPALQALAQAYGPEKLVVLTVNFKESAAKVTQFVASTGLRLPVLTDPNGDIARRWGVTIFPTTVLIAADGQPRQRLRGEFDWLLPEAAARVAPLLKR